MKKNIILCFIFALIINSFLNAESLNVYVYGGRGCMAGARYIGIKDELKTNSLREINEIAKKSFKKGGLKILEDCRKLSKSEEYLMWSAINEYNYSDNEVYGIDILEDPTVKPFRWLTITAIIKNGGDDVDWVGFYYNTK